MVYLSWCYNGFDDFRVSLFFVIDISSFLILWVHIRHTSCIECASLSAAIL